MRRLGHLPALDGLRGVAIALVVAYHYWKWPRAGWLGVDLFFVLSGFLITTLLLEEHAETGRIRLRAFYARRARRLFPALAVLLAAFVLLNAVRGTDALGLVARWGLYTANIYEAFWPSHASHLVGLNHLWSLAQEEQFYLVWPAALLGAVRFHNPARVLLVLAAALIVYRAVLVLGGATGPRIYFSPDTHSEGLVLGSALAFARRSEPLVVTRRLVACTALLCVPLVAFEASSTPSTQLFLLPIFEVASVVFVAAAVAGTIRLPRLLVWLGGISYSLYLWHAFLLWAFHGHNRLPALALSVAAAYASTRWIERPFRRGAASLDTFRYRNILRAWLAPRPRPTSSTPSPSRAAARSSTP
jgi:peptidoglycan/LPS O-acetylase OafA/YrhL